MRTTRWALFAAGMLTACSVHERQLIPRATKSASEGGSGGDVNTSSDGGTASGGNTGGGFANEAGAPSSSAGGVTSSGGASSEGGSSEGGSSGGASSEGGSGEGGSSTGGKSFGAGGRVGVSGSPSGGAGVAGTTSIPTTCTISNVAYKDGTINPSNSCVSCQPAKSAIAWSPVTEGTPCGTTADRVCHTGACVAGCGVDAAYYAAGAANPANPCQTCQPSQSNTAWSNVPTATCVQAVDAGGSHTCALVNGSARCWGYNLYGQLGNGLTTNSPTPVQVTGLTAGVTAIATGNLHSCAIVAGAAQCWGYNASGQLGNGTTSPTTNPTPVQVTGLTSGVTAIAAGTSHSCAIVAGAVQCWGSNAAGQLGNGATAPNSPSPVAVTGLGSGVTAIAVGGSHSCAIVNGGVQCWGYNNYGQLGNNTTTNSPTAVQAVLSGATAVAAGYSHSCAVISGAVQCWGYNISGQVGNATTANSLVPVPAVTSRATEVDCGTNHTCAIVNNAVQCWGYNSSYELGNGSTAISNVPVAVTALTTPVQAIVAGTGAGRGGSHTCALTNGSVRCWGYNNYGQLGIGTTTVSSTPAAAVVFQ